MNTILEFPTPLGDDGKPLYTTPKGRDLFCFDQGYETGYHQGQADATARYEAEIAGAAAHTRLWVTWGLVLSFLIGGLFGVGACAYVWPLVAAGVLP